MERVEELFRGWAAAVSLGIEAAAVLIVAYGSLQAFLQVAGIVLRPGANHGERKAVWRGYGMWLLLGLEFELAADIVVTVVAPTWRELGELGVIAVIRTFLNYFLEKDLEAAAAEGEVPPDAGSDRTAGSA